MTILSVLFRAFSNSRQKAYKIDISRLTLVHKLGDSEHMVHALSGAIARMNLLYICWANCCSKYSRLTVARMSAG